MEKNALYVCFFPRVAEARADGEVVEAEVGEEEVGEEVEEGAMEAEEAEVTVEAANETVAGTEDLEEHAVGSEVILTNYGQYD